MSLLLNIVIVNEEIPLNFWTLLIDRRFDLKTAQRVGSKIIDDNLGFPLKYRIKVKMIMNCRAFALLVVGGSMLNVLVWHSWCLDSSSIVSVRCLEKK